MLRHERVGGKKLDNLQYPQGVVAVVHRVLVLLPFPLLLQLLLLRVKKHQCIQRDKTSSCRQLHSHVNGIVRNMFVVLMISTIVVAVAVGIVSIAFFLGNSNTITAAGTFCFCRIFGLTHRRRTHHQFCLFTGGHFFLMCIHPSLLEDPIVVVVIVVIQESTTTTTPFHGLFEHNIKY